MLTLEITIDNKSHLNKLESLLKNFDFIKSIKKREPKKTIDPISLISQDSLAEEWNSPEDERWDKVL